MYYFIPPYISLDLAHGGGGSFRAKVGTCEGGINLASSSEFKVNYSYWTKLFSDNISLLGSNYWNKEMY